MEEQIIFNWFIFIMLMFTAFVGAYNEHRLNKIIKQMENSKND